MPQSIKLQDPTKSTAVYVAPTYWGYMDREGTKRVPVMMPWFGIFPMNQQYVGISTT